MAYVLRKYQKEAADAAVMAFQRGTTNGLLVLPVAAGKSLVIADISSRLDSPLLVFSPSQEILKQNYEKICSYDILDVGIYSASVGIKNIRRITLATIGSVHNHMEDFRAFKYILVDEAHNISSKGGMYKEFIEQRSDRVVVGLTASPYRLERAYDGCSILKFLTRTRPRVFSKVLYVCQTGDLLRQGYISPVEYFDVSDQLSFDLRRVNVNSTGADYDEESLQLEYERSGFMYDLENWTLRVLHPNDGSQRNGVLVFTRFVRESKFLVDRLREKGVPAEIVSGDTPTKERARIVEDFKNRKIQVLANANCLDSETEILTRNGWKGINTVSIDDDIAQYANGIISFVKPYRIIKNENYSDDFVSVNGRYMNIRVTKDHRMVYVKRQYDGTFGEERIKSAKELVEEKCFYVPVSGMAKTENIVMQKIKIPCSKRRFVDYNAYNYRKKGMNCQEAEIKAIELYERRIQQQVKNPSELTLDECRFIGFFVCDGNVSKAKNGGMTYSFVQSLVNPQLCEWIENLLDKIGINYSTEIRKQNTNVIIGRTCEVADYKRYTLYKGTGGDGQYIPSTLHKLVPYLDKRGTELFWGLNQEQFYALCEGMFKANGNHGNNKEYKGSWFIVNNKGLADLLQGLGTCRGFRIMLTEKLREGCQPLYYISVLKQRYHQLVKEKLVLTNCVTPEKTWCVSVPSGVIVTRRKGRVAIVGNCLTMGFDYPALDTVIIAHPTRSLARYYQQVGRVIRLYDGKKAWCLDLCGNYKKFGGFADLKIECPLGNSRWVVTSNGRPLTGKY